MSEIASNTIRNSLIANIEETVMNFLVGYMGSVYNKE